MNRNFIAMLKAKWAEGKFVCVGLDPDVEKIPQALSLFRTGPQKAFVFCCQIVDATADLVCAYKPNAAFFEAFGSTGLIYLEALCAKIREVAPGVPIIYDAKRGDIGNTNVGYVKSAFENLEADAITLFPYMGEESLRPFLEMKDKGAIILCRTSNPRAGEFQDLSTYCLEGRSFKGSFRSTGVNIPLYQYVAHQVAHVWNKNGNCAVVVGATAPAELKEVRSIVRDLPILIPGIGAQGGDIEATVKAGKDSQGAGIVVNLSRSVLYASSGGDFLDAARAEVERVNNLINQFRR